MKIKVVGMWVILSLIISGCATVPSSGGNGSGNSGPNKSTTFAWQACLTGAILGGLLTRNSDTDKRRNAIFLGCAAGALAGYIVGQRTQEYANANAALDAESARNRQVAQALRDNNRKLESNIQNYKREIASIRSSKVSNQEKQKQLAETKKIVGQQAAKARTTLKSVSDDLVIARRNKNKYSRQAPPARKKQWDQEIVALEREKSILTQKVNTLMAIGNSL